MSWPRWSGCWLALFHATKLTWRTPQTSSSKIAREYLRDHHKRGLQVMMRDKEAQASPVFPL